MSKVLNSFVIAVAVAAVLLGGCAQFRGIPSHGGGKRFDEEQRAVAGAIRRTIACMDLSDLGGKKTLLAVTNMFTSGSGTTNWPGPQSLNLYGNYNPMEAWLDRTWQPLLLPPSAHYTREQREEDRHTYSGSLSVRTMGSYRAANNITEGDVNYFRASLEMKCKHVGVPVVRNQPQAILHVLIDVLGTNRSRNDSIVIARDQLLASCEVTYYAQDVVTGKLIFKARQTGAVASYEEHRLLFAPASIVHRSIHHAKPLYFDVDGNGRGKLARGVDLPGGLPATRPAKPIRDPRQRAQLLERLYDRAKFYIESGNAEAAADDIQWIRDIDPGYEGLGELTEEAQRMDGEP